jgi:hypothetical protein
MASQMPKKVRRAAATQMTKITAPVQKPTNGKPSAEEKAVLAFVKTVLNPQGNKTEEKKLVLKAEQA